MEEKKKEWVERSKKNFIKDLHLEIELLMKPGDSVTFDFVEEETNYPENTLWSGLGEGRHDYWISYGGNQDWLIEGEGP